MSEIPSWKYQHDMRIWEKKAEFGIALFKAAMDFANLAIKSIILVNGAAAIALLAFLGNIWGKDGFAQQLASLSGRSLGLFVYGTAAGVLASTLAYLAQIVFTEMSLEDGRRNWWGEALRALAIVAGGAGILCFMLGADAGYDAFTTPPPRAPVGAGAAG